MYGWTYLIFINLSYLLIFGVPAMVKWQRCRGGFNHYAITTWNLCYRSEMNASFRHIYASTWSLIAIKISKIARYVQHFSEDPLRSMAKDSKNVDLRNVNSSKFLQIYTSQPSLNFVPWMKSSFKVKLKLVCGDEMVIEYLNGDNTVVYTKDACKSYENRTNGIELVLNDFCMSAKLGSVLVKNSERYIFFLKIWLWK